MTTHKHCLLLCIVLAFSVLPLSDASAQPNTVHGYAFRSKQTFFGHVVRGGAVGYVRDVTPWLTAEANAQAGISRNNDPVSLIVVDFAYNDRTQLSADLRATLFPLRLNTFGASNRFGVSLGPVVRWKRETLHVAGFPSTITADQTFRLNSVARAAAEWDALGPNFSVVSFYHPGGGSPDYPNLPDGWTDPGQVYALMFTTQGVDVGLLGGLAYDVARGRFTVGGRADYRRFRDQRAVSGSHSLDFSVRTGYRF